MTTRVPLTELDAQNIALIKPSALGDIIHSLPVLEALRIRFPQASITWVVNKSYAPLLEDHPSLNAVLPFDRGGAASGWWRSSKQFLGFLADLRQRRFDLVIDLQGLLRSALMCWASRAPRQVGLRSAREGARWFYSDVLDDDLNGMHAVDRYWLVAQSLGVGQLPKQFMLPAWQAETGWARDHLRGMPRPWIMINLGTRWETKRWPVRHFVDLACRATRQFGGSVVLVGSPTERILAEEFAVTARTSAPVADLTGRTTLRQLTAVLRMADVMVSNDSGPLHLAAALGRPVVAPFTCTSPVRTGPYGQRGGAVLTSVSCAASYLKCCDRMVCMSDLSPDRLWPILERHLLSCQRCPA